MYNHPSIVPGIYEVCKVVDVSLWVFPICSYVNLVVAMHSLTSCTFQPSTTTAKAYNPVSMHAGQNSEAGGIKIVVLSYDAIAVIAIVGIVATAVSSCQLNYMLHCILSSTNTWGIYCITRDCPTMSNPVYTGWPLNDNCHTRQSWIYVCSCLEGTRRAMAIYMFWKWLRRRP